MKSLAPLYRLCPTKASSTAPRFSPLHLPAFVKPRQQSNLHLFATNRQPNRLYTASSAQKMSSGFSNADTGSKPADEYKAKNRDETSLKEKVEDLVSFIDACKFSMMTTRIESSGLLVSRCMALAAKEGGGVDLLFHTNTESGKTDDLHHDPKINIAFLDSSGQWASISGEASILTDRATVKKYYTPSLKAWLGDLGDGKHDGGPDDPRIGVIKVTAQTATYAVNSKNMLSRGLEVAKGTVTGDAAQVNKLRELTTDELKQWRQTAEA